jgi:hypothetical protein
LCLCWRYSAKAPNHEDQKRFGDYLGCELCCHIFCCLNFHDGTLGVLVVW